MEFQSFPSLSRLSRRCVITEKLDGTNAQVCIVDKLEPAWAARVGLPFVAETRDSWILAGSRSRYITPGDDNFGFAAWVRDHAEELAQLGPGRHFGEWWGQGIQRRYGLQEKRFSLFNTIRWCRHDQEPGIISSDDPRTQRCQERLPACCDLVPVMYDGVFDSSIVDGQLEILRATGSKAAPGFMNPEGVVIFHVAAKTAFKKTLHGDGHKSQH